MEVEMKRAITVIVQTSSECNFNCAYCYMKASTGGIKQKMSLEEMERLIKNCSVGFDEVKFCWHGGEPLLMGIEFYQKALQVQQKITVNKKIEFKNSIQTNGALLDDEWLSFFRKEKFSVGVSFDAPSEVNQFQRARERISETYIFDIAERLKKNNLSFNALCVVSRHNVKRGEEIFNFFKSFNANSYSLLLMMKTSLADCPEQPTNKELFELYKTTFELWLNEKHGFKVIEPIHTIMHSLLGGKTPKLCSFGNHCLIRMITVAPKGNVIPCGSFVSQEFILGNVFKESLLRTLYSKRAENFRSRRERYIKTRCLDCEFVSICRGGCREVAFWHSGNYDGEYPYCQARKETFLYMKNRLKEVLEKGLVR